LVGYVHWQVFLVEFDQVLTELLSSLHEWGSTSNIEDHQ
jgi:hypothetical protein